jgi:hypothetical protein
MITARQFFSIDDDCQLKKVSDIKNNNIDEINNYEQ